MSRDENGMLTPDGRKIARDTFRALFDVLDKMCEEQEGKEFTIPTPKVDNKQK